MIPRTRVFRTAVFRASLLYACLFSLVAAGALAFIYWSTAARFEQQTDARLRLETDVVMNLYRQQLFPAFSETLQRLNQEDGRTQIFFYQLVDLRISGPPRVLSLVEPTPDGSRSYATLKLGEIAQVNPDRSERINDPMRVLVTNLTDDYRLVVGRDLRDQQELLRHTLGLLIAATVLMITVALTGGALLARGMVRRVSSVRDIAAEIIGGDLSKRMPVNTGSDEFDHLNLRLNEMLDRIQQLMRGMREVTDNVAHDLRTPLNRLRNGLDVALLEARGEDEYRTAIEDAINDADSLMKTFNALLSIAQAEAGVRRNEWCDVNLARIAEDIAELYGGAAEEQGIRFEAFIDEVEPIRGNRHLLAQAIGNLVDNAIKYTPADGRIELCLAKVDDAVRLDVADTGPGIPTEDRERALQRFARLDNARSSVGNGLGLSLVKAVATLHGAALALEDNAPGLRVGVVFPS